MRFLATLAFAALMAGAVSAQSCSTLAVSGDINPGSTLSLALSGAPADSWTAIALGDTLGSTTIGGGMLMVTLDLDAPFLILPFGRTDANGDASLDITVPASVPVSALPSMDLYVQAATLDVSFGMGAPSISFCTSNTGTIAAPTAAPAGS